MSSVLFVSALVGAMSASALPAGTAPTAGQTLAPSSGTSETALRLTLAAPNNTCPGDAATGGYRWNTYMVPSSVDPATLTYNSNGPIAPGAGVFTSPLYSAIGQTPQVNRSSLASGTGQITGIVDVTLAVFTPGQIPAGSYRIGYACTRAGQTERFWQTEMTVTANASGGPAQISWTLAATGTTTTTVAPTSTAATTTTTVAGATTTTAAGATTTTSTAATTTTTAAGATTTTTVAGATTTTAVASLGPSTGTGSGGSFGTGSSGGTIPMTGSSSLPIVFWAVMALVFGRMAVLLAKPVKVLPPRAP